MARHDIAVLGASAGGVQALSTVVRGLPESFAGSAFVVLHLAPHAPSALQSILARGASVPVATAEDEMPIERGHVYVAGPDLHLTLEDRVMRVSFGPRVNSSRPSVDTLFRSAAATFGPRTVGVVLSGALDDGTAGLAAIKEAGGLVVVQDPSDARHRGMPTSALAHVVADLCAPASEIAAYLAEVAEELPVERQRGSAYLPRA